MRPPRTAAGRLRLLLRSQQRPGRSLQTWVRCAAAWRSWARTWPGSARAGTLAAPQMRKRRRRRAGCSMR